MPVRAIGRASFIMMTRIESKGFGLGAVALVAAVWAVWGWTGGFEYIRLDDNLYTWDYPFVANGFSWANFKGVCCKLTQGGIWMPLTSLTYMLDISLFGAGPGPHHLMSVVWHSINAILVFYLIYELTGRKSLFAAFAGAALWAVHPQRCESVSWIASRKDLIFTFFTLLGLIAWRKGHTFLTYFLMFAGCCSKPTAMVFPAIAFCVEKDAHLIFTKLRQAPFQTFKSYFIRYLPMVVLTVATAILTVYSQTHWDGLEARGLNEGYGSFPWRCFNALVALGLYFAQWVVPYGLHIMYRAMTGGVPTGTGLGLLVLALILAGLVWAFFKRRNWPLLWLMAFWFLAAIGPTLGVAGSFGQHSRADRFLYLPMIGVSVLVASLLANIAWTRWRRMACVALLAVYGGVAAHNSYSYLNNYTLFQRVVDFDPEHPWGLQHVAMELCARFDDPDRGIAVFRRAMELDPANEDAAGQMCYAMARRGHPEDVPTILELCEPLLMNPGLDDSGMPTEALGIVMMRQRKWDEAIRFFTASLNAEKRKYPPDETLIQIAMCHYNRGDLGKAGELFGELAQSSADVRVKKRAAQALDTIRTRQGK